MRLEYFEYLIEIANTKNMRLASEILHLTPQALSVCIKNMEQEVGFLILDRKPKGVEFTENGEKLLACAERIVNDYHNTLKEIYLDNSDLQITEELFIYSTPIINMCISDNLIEKYRKSYSHLVLNALTSEPEIIMECVSSAKSGNVIGLVTYSGELPQLPDHLEKQKCFSDECFLAVAKNSELDKKGYATIKDFEGLTLVHCTKQLADDIPIAGMFSEITDKITHTYCNSIYSWGKMIGSGLGAGFIVRRALMQGLRDGSINQEKVIGIPIDTKPYLNCYCIYQKNAPEYVKRIILELMKL